MVKLHFTANFLTSLDDSNSTSVPQLMEYTFPPDTRHPHWHFSGYVGLLFSHTDIWKAEITALDSIPNTPAYRREQISSLIKFLWTLHLTPLEHAENPENAGCRWCDYFKVLLTLRLFSHVKKRVRGSLWTVRVPEETSLGINWQ